MYLQNVSVVLFCNVHLGGVREGKTTSLLDLSLHIMQLHCRVFVNAWYNWKACIQHLKLWTINLVVELCRVTNWSVLISNEHLKLQLTIFCSEHIYLASQDSRTQGSTKNNTILQYIIAFEALIFHGSSLKRISAIIFEVHLYSSYEMYLKSLRQTVRLRNLQNFHPITPYMVCLAEYVLKL